jgi:hypothetical protein
MPQPYSDNSTFIVTPPSIRPIIQRIQAIFGIDNPVLNLPQENLVQVIRKTLWGCIGVLLTTIMNFCLILYFSGGEEVWICYTLCTIDGKLTSDEYRECC